MVNVREVLELSTWNASISGLCQPSTAEPSVSKLGMVICIIMDQSVKQEDWFAGFKFWVTVRVHIIRYDCVYHNY